MSLSNSNISDCEESMTESDNNSNEVKPGTSKKQNKTKRDAKLKKNMSKTKIDCEESMTESDNYYNEVKPRTSKKQNKTKIDAKLKKNMSKTKVKNNSSYLDRIAHLIKDVKVGNDLINSMMVKQGDEIVNIKLQSDNEVCSDYWTINHYKIKNIQNISAQDRWKEAECSVKILITDLAKDQGLANDLSNIIQTIFTRFMSDPNKNIGCIKKSKS